MTNKLVKKIEAASAEEWDRVWEACAYATYFHSREWSEIWSEQKPGKFRPDARLVTFADGKTAILPLTRQKRYRGLANTYLASPGGTYGGWISTDELNAEHAEALVEALVGMGSLRWRVSPYESLGGNLFGLNLTPQPPLQWVGEGELNRVAPNERIWIVQRSSELRLTDVIMDETQALALDGDFEAIFKRWNAGHRSGVKKAQKAGIRARRAAGLDDWRAYYGVYEDSVRRWGENAHGRQPWTLFEAMCRRESKHIRLWLADYQGEVIGGIVCFYARKHVVYWHGATLEAHFELGVSKLVMYEAIRDACEKGYRWFDFNPSAGLEGVREFKRRFGAESLACPMVVGRAWWERG